MHAYMYNAQMDTLEIKVIVFEFLMHIHNLIFTRKGRVTTTLYAKESEKNKYKLVYRNMQCHHLALN